MQSYWDQRARLNAAYYVDTSLSYDDPDMDAFWATGETIVKRALQDGPVAVPVGGTAVELGCGLGRNLRALAARYDRAIGLDISQEMLDRARDHLEPGIELVRCDGTSLRPLPDEAADFVLSIIVLQHIPDVAVIAGYVRDIARVLRPGGYAVLQWNGSRGTSLGWAARRWALIIRRRLVRPAEPYGREVAEFLGSRIPLARMRTVMEHAGLEVCGTAGDGTLDSWVWARKPERPGAAA
jgi:ubiquinone/menaquinone biosynthesis C-methylase UbiE